MKNILKSRLLHFCFILALLLICGSVYSQNKKAFAKEHARKLLESHYVQVGPSGQSYRLINIKTGEVNKDPLTGLDVNASIFSPNRRLNKLIGRELILQTSYGHGRVRPGQSLVPQSTTHSTNTYTTKTTSPELTLGSFTLGQTPPVVNGVYKIDEEAIINGVGGILSVSIFHKDRPMHIKKNFMDTHLYLRVASPKEYNDRFGVPKISKITFEPFNKKDGAYKYPQLQTNSFVGYVSNRFSINLLTRDGILWAGSKGNVEAHISNNGLSLYDIKLSTFHRSEQAKGIANDF